MGFKFGTVGHQPRNSFEVLISCVTLPNVGPPGPQPCLNSLAIKLDVHVAFLMKSDGVLVPLGYTLSLKFVNLLFSHDIGKEVFSPEDWLSMSDLALLLELLLFRQLGVLDSSTDRGC